MGTNFYRRNIPTKLRKQQIIEAVNNDNFGKAKNLLDNEIEEIHICKRSAGWSICFDHNWGVYYEPTRESLDAFLRADDAEIVDEYGEVISVDEFWKMVDEWNNSRPDLWDSEKYQKDMKKENPNWTEWPCTTDINRCYEKWGIKTKWSDFYDKSGLRWSVFSDFC